MTKGKPRIAIIGAGLGGPAAAALLQRAGYPVTIYEQSASFSRIGAGINISPNVTRILDRIGVCEPLAKTGVRTEHWVSRVWNTGELLLDYPMGEALEKRYGAPYLCVHRGDWLTLQMSRPVEAVARTQHAAFALAQVVRSMTQGVRPELLLDGVVALLARADRELVAQRAGCSVLCLELLVERSR